MSEEKNPISPEEAQRLYEQFHEDVRANLPVYEEQDMIIQARNREDAIRRAFIQAIQRERSAPKPKYKLKVWEAGDWFELTRINPDGGETPVQILGSQHNKLCAFWSIVADLGVEIEEVTVPDNEVK